MRARVVDTKLSGVALNLLLFCGSLFSLWAISPFNSFFQDAGVTFNSIFAGAAMAVLSIFTVAALYFTVEAIFISPARVEYDARSEATEAASALNKFKEQRDANLAVSLEKNGDLSTILSGETSETGGGDRYVAYLGRAEAACLLVENTGLTTAKNCKARLIRVWRLDGEKASELRVVEGVPLGWSRTFDDGVLTTDILSGEMKRLYISSVRANGAMSLWQKLELQPIEYHLMFREPGQYRLELVISVDDRDATTVHLDIHTKVAPREVNKLPKAEGAMSLHHPVIVGRA